MHSCSTAATGVLPVPGEPAGNGEAQLRRAFLRAAAVLHPHADVVAHRTDGSRLVLARLDPVALERPDDAVRVGAFEAHAAMTDARGAPRRGRRGASAPAAARGQQVV